MSTATRYVTHSLDLHVLHVRIVTMMSMCSVLCGVIADDSLGAKALDLDPSVAFELHFKHGSLARNKRCLLAYLYDLMSRP